MLVCIPGIEKETIRKYGRLTTSQFMCYSVIWGRIVHVLQG